MTKGEFEIPDPQVILSPDKTRRWISEAFPKKTNVCSLEQYVAFEIVDPNNPDEEGVPLFRWEIACGSEQFKIAGFKIHTNSTFPLKIKPMIYHYYRTGKHSYPRMGEKEVIIREDDRVMRREEMDKIKEFDPNATRQEFCKQFGNFDIDLRNIIRR